MIREIGRVVRKGGKLLIVDFQRKDTGFGPPIGTRVSQAKAVKLFTERGFRPLTVKLLSHHYLLVFTKD